MNAEIARQLTDQAEGSLQELAGYVDRQIHLCATNGFSEMKVPQLKKHSEANYAALITQLKEKGFSVDESGALITIRW